MPYVLAAVAVVMPAILIVQVIRGRARVQCCVVVPLVEGAAPPNATSSPLS